MTKLKYLRLSMGLTQDELASNCGVHRWKISLTENGRFIPTPEEVRLLAGAVNCDQKSLLKQVLASRNDKKPSP